MEISKVCKINVLDKVSTHVIVKELRKDPDDLYVFDIVIKDSDGNIIETLAIDRFELVSNALFKLTKTELGKLINGESV